MHLFVMRRELISYIVIVKSIALIDHVINVDYGLVKEKNKMIDKEKIRLLVRVRINLLINKLENNEKLLIDDFIWFCIADYLLDKEESDV